ncbi:MAG: NADH-quinone oxidoreductase subunit N [Candidatus Marsarchaeota archaeon]|nr:NADH-quinone oxidoreductase subunit N [Candidatus Marsarchaeota archaeon]MCL5102120.1 NADH-quinone oxidoreductase subunit N [Candidatus Marsarchaeota archaeon]
MQILVNFAIPVLFAALLFSGIATLFHKNKKLSVAINSSLFLLILVTGIYYSVTGISFNSLSLYHIYPFSSFLLMLFSLAFVLVSIAAYELDSSYLKFGMLLPLLSIGVFSVSMASSLLTIIVSMELMTVPTILLIALNGKDFAEPSTKLFLLSAISIAVLAFAIALIFPYDSSLSITQAVSGTIGSAYFMVLSLVLFVAALGVEAALFPFNLWIPDVYQGSPSGVSPLIAGINKKVAFVALIEISFVVFAGDKSSIVPVFEILAVLTMFFGNLAAMVQTNVKRLLAYSSISQAGYIMVGLASVTAFGLESSLFQIFAHSFMIIGAFVIAGFLAANGIESIGGYSGLYKRNGFLAFSLTVIMLSMAGIPGLIGFVGKFLLFSSAISSGLIALAFIGIINSFISIYYYGKLISSIYSGASGKTMHVPNGIYVVVFIAIAIVIAFGIYPAPLMAVSSRAAASLFGII